MTLKFGLALAIFLFPTVSATNDHKSRTIEVHHNGRSSGAPREPGPSRAKEAGKPRRAKESQGSVQQTAAKTSTGGAAQTSTGGAIGEGCSKEEVVAVFPGEAKDIKDQMVNDCPGALISGSVCTPACKDGLFGFGSITCTDGEINQDATCEKACTITPPINGGLGDCPNSMVLQEGSECQYTCEVQYHSTGSTKCEPGDSGLSEAQCVRDALMNQAYDAEGNNIDFEKFSSLSISQAPANDVFAEAGQGTFTFLGNWDTDCYFIKAPAADAAVNASKVQITIKVARPVTVFVCLPGGNTQRIEGFMKWAYPPADGGSSEHGWHDALSASLNGGRSLVGPSITFGGTNYNTSDFIFRKNFNSEEIMLPGNEFEEINYLVYVCPQDGSHCSSEAVGGVFPVNAKAPNMNSNGGCDGQLAVHSSCRPECMDGYIAKGSIVCTLEGLITTAVCEPALEEGAEGCSIGVPDNGNFDGVESTCSPSGKLARDTSCVPGCDAGYQVEPGGAFRCYEDPLGNLVPVSTECIEIAPGSSSLLDAPETPKNKKLMRSAMDEAQLHGN